jgi:hypothetical protein
MPIHTIHIYSSCYLQVVISRQVSVCNGVRISHESHLLHVLLIILVILYSSSLCYFLSRKSTFYLVIWS